MNRDAQDDDWTITLMAYASGSLDPAGRAGVERALAESEALRGELRTIELMRRAVGVDEPPATVPTSVWDRIDAAPTGGPLPRPTAESSHQAPPGTAVVTPLRRRRRLTVALSAAAAVVVALAAGVILTQGGGVGDGTADPGPDTVITTAASDTPLAGQPRFVLRQAGLAMRRARTATFDINGTIDVSVSLSVLPDRRYDVGVELTGTSDVVFGQGDQSDYSFSTEFVGVSGPLALRPPPTMSELVVVDGVVYESDDGEPFVERPQGEPDDRGLFAQLVVTPDVYARLPDLADGDIEDFGVSELRGVPVRRLRFDLVPGAIGSTESADTAEVWIGEDGLVRRLQLTSSGPTEIEGTVDATFDLEMDIVLDESGQPLEITAPS